MVNANPDGAQSTESNSNQDGAQSTESNSNQQRYNLRSGDRQAPNSPRINIGTLPPGDIQDYNYPESVNP
jgi:hypothetical protein